MASRRSVCYRPAMLAVGTAAAILQMVQAYPEYWWRMRGNVLTCDRPHPTRQWAKHGSPVPSIEEDIVFNLVDLDAKVQSTYVPGADYILEVEVQTPAHAFVTASSGKFFLPDDKETDVVVGYIEEDECLMHGVYDTRRGDAGHGGIVGLTLPWQAPSCQDVCGTEVQVFVTAAAAKTGTFLQHGMTMQAAEGSCSCSDAEIKATKGRQRYLELPAAHGVRMAASYPGASPLPSPAPSALPDAVSSPDSDADAPEDADPSSGGGDSDDADAPAISSPDNEASAGGGTPVPSPSPAASPTIDHEDSPAGSTPSSPAATAQDDAPADTSSERVTPDQQSATSAQAARSQGSSGSEAGSAGVFIAVVVMIAIAAAVVLGVVIIRRRRLRRQQHDFASLEMRNFAQWQDDAGL